MNTEYTALYPRKKHTPVDVLVCIRRLSNTTLPLPNDCSGPLCEHLRNPPGVAILACPCPLSTIIQGGAESE
jgi:hypothetical protein